MRLLTLKEKLLPKDTPAYRRRNAREIFLIGLPMVIGVKPTLLSDHKINASLRIKSMHLNRSGRISGGTIMAMADAMGAAGAVINRAPGFSGGTIESKTNFFNAGTGPVMTGECIPLHIGRTTSVWQTTLYNPDGSMIAVVTQTQIALPRRSKA